jgi:uncharacterized protein with PIN domain
MLGHDVHYYRNSEDKKLVELAKSEKRVLLTRDLELYQKAVTRGIEAVLVEVADEAEKLANLAKRFNFKLEIELSSSRCPKCNTPIMAVAKKSVINQIPPATSTYYNDFWKCPRCSQIYWRGAHWKMIEKTLKEARDISES